MKKTYALSAISIASIAWSMPALAQNTPDPESGNAEIIVTAQKKSETLQKVPAAVAVVDANALVRAGATNITGLSSVTSGLQIGLVRTQSVLFMRGVGQTVNSPNADSAVAANLNGIYMPAEVAGTAFFDIDRVEVLPGPQGTLYGRNSTGGVLNLMSKRPGNELSAAGFIELGNYSRIQAEVGVDVPLSATLKSRTVGSITNHDGYWSNGTDAQRTRAVRETLVWTPSDRTKITAIGSYSRETGLDSTLQTQPSPACGPRCANYDPKALGHFNNARVVQLSLEFAQQLSDNVNLTYLGGYNELKADRASTVFYAPATTLPLAPLSITTNLHAQSHELRLDGKWGNLSGLIGTYYFDQGSYFYQEVRNSATQHQINPFDANSHGAAVFGQATYSLTDALRFTGGLRYSNVVKSVDGFNSTYAVAGTTETLSVKRPYTGRTTLNRVDWKVGLEYDLAPTSMLYANIASGFNPGGFSTNPAVPGAAIQTTAAAAAPFLPVTLVAYSAGIKNKLADGKLTLNLEGFYYDYKNYQVSARDPATALNLVFNAEKATIYGVQLDTRFMPTPNDTFGVNATYLHAVADKLIAGGVNFSGFELPNSPAWTVSANYQHAFDLANGAQIRGNVNFKYASSRWLLYTHLKYSDQAATTRTDLSLGYYAPDDRWSVRAWARNIENTLEKQTCAGANPNTVAGCTWTAPRTFGGTVSFKY